MAPNAQAQQAMLDMHADLKSRGTRLLDENHFLIKLHAPVPELFLQPVRNPSYFDYYYLRRFLFIRSMHILASAATMGFVVRKRGTNQEQYVIVHETRAVTQVKALNLTTKPRFTTAKSYVKPQTQFPVLFNVLAGIPEQDAKDLFDIQSGSQDYADRMLNSCSEMLAPNCYLIKNLWEIPKHAQVLGDREFTQPLPQFP